MFGCDGFLYSNKIRNTFCDFPSENFNGLVFGGESNFVGRGVGDGVAWGGDAEDAFNQFNIS
jgi:hypothetical protein